MGGTAIRRALLGWYERNRRDLPWRRTTTPIASGCPRSCSSRPRSRRPRRTTRPFVERFPHPARPWPTAGGGGPRSLVGPRLLPPRAQPARGAPATSSSATAAASRGRSRPRWPCREWASTPPAPCSRSRYDAAAARRGRQRAPGAGTALALRGPEWRSDGAYYNRAESCSTGKRPATGTRRSWSSARPCASPRDRPAPPAPSGRSCRALAQGVVDELPEGRARRAPGRRHGGRRPGRAGRPRAARAPARGTAPRRMWEVPQTSLESRGLRRPRGRARGAPRPSRRPRRPRRARPPCHHVSAHHARGLPRTTDRPFPATPSGFSGPVPTR